MTRECGNCTACCEGWLSGEVKEIKFYAGTPCHFLKEKQSCHSCSIYEERPKMCSDFICEWKRDESIPEWLKPSVSKSLLTIQERDGFKFYMLTEVGQKMDSSVLSWVIMHCVNNGYNLRYTVDGGVYKIGAEEFWRNPTI